MCILEYYGMKTVLLYLVKSIHVCYSLSVMFVPLLINDFFVLSILLALIVMNLYSWYVMNACPITFLEEYLGETTHNYEKDNAKKSFITVFLQNTTGISDITLSNIIAIIPVISAMVCIAKLNKTYYEKIYSSIFLDPPGEVL